MLESRNQGRETMRGNTEKKDEEREKRVYEASVTGSVSLLKQLMAEDLLTLARAAVTCFNETPLHVAAMLGHLNFTKYLLTKKPDMTMAVDSRGRSPLHLASANGYDELVNILLLANSDACLIRDEDGRTPLHLAVMKCQVEVMRKLFSARRQVIWYKLDEGETILHSTVKQNRLGVVKLLLEQVGEVDFLNSKDDYGNTVLHTSTALKQFEVNRKKIQIIQHVL